jgi:hypothetical protein
VPQVLLLEQRPFRKLLAGAQRAPVLGIARQLQGPRDLGARPFTPRREILRRRGIEQFLRSLVVERVAADQALAENLLLEKSGDGRDGAHVISRNSETGAMR